MAFIDPNYQRDVKLLNCNRDLVTRAYINGLMDLDGYQYGTHEFIKDCRREIELDYLWNCDSELFL